MHHVLERAWSVLDRVLSPAAEGSDFYGASYFSGAGDEGKRSGYDSYTRSTSHADALARSSAFRGQSGGPRWEVAAAQGAGATRAAKPSTEARAACDGGECEVT